MGIRTDQHYGLSERGRKLVEGEQVLLYVRFETRQYLNDDHTEVVREETLDAEPVYGSSVRKEKSDRTYFGMFEDEYSLYKYTLPDGTVYFEDVQAMPWSSGPCIFLALRDEKGAWVQESLWTDKEAEDYGFHPMDLRPS